MKRRSKQSRLRISGPEGLESRGLLASGGLGVVLDLGEVSRGLALRGVEVTAPIAAHGSVTFRFEAEAGGDYLLKIRHAGEGLAIEARGPSGSAGIDPGPAGPFSTIALPLEAAGYEIKASADGDQPVFVDWELLLASGVGQSGARGSTLASPPIGLPPAPPAPSASTPGMAPAPAPNEWGSAVSPSMVATARPVGRVGAIRPIAPVGPTLPEGEWATADAGLGLPSGPLTALGAASPKAPDGPPMPTANLLALEAMGDARQDAAALEGSSWLERLAALPGPAAFVPGSPQGRAGGEGEVEVEVEGVGASTAPAFAGAAPVEEPEGLTTTAASPGLIACGMLAASAFRRRPGFKLLMKSGKSPRRSDFMPKSMA